MSDRTHTGLATLSPNSRFDWPWSFNERKSDVSILDDWQSRDGFLDESIRSPENKAARKAKKKKHRIRNLKSERRKRNRLVRIKNLIKQKSRK